MSATGDQPSEDPSSPPTEAIPEATAAPPVSVGLTRLCVDINAETEAALKRVMTEQGVTGTEAARRLCGWGLVAYATVREGGEVLLCRRVEGRWRQERLVLLGTDTPSGPHTPRGGSDGLVQWVLVVAGCLVAVVLIATLVLALAAPHRAVAAPAPSAPVLLAAGPMSVVGHSRSGGGLS